VTSQAELSFTRVSGDHSSVWVAKADGSHARRIVRDAFAGRLSPSGQRIAYLRRGDHGALLRLYVAQVGGGPAEPVAAVLLFAWSPQRDLVAYTDRKALRVFDVRTGKARTLVQGGDIRAISFAPSGDALAYAQANGRIGRGFRADIFSVRIADGRTRRLTEDGHSGEPVWGPTWIAYRHYVRTKWPQIGGTWLMRRDGSGKRPFARGDQNPGRAHYGLMPIEFSRDGTRLLACTDAEFGCSPVTFFVASKKRHFFSAGQFPPHIHGLVAPEDMSGDGRRLLVWIGSVDGGAAEDIYAVPFSGGKPRLVAHNADSAGWRG
jgi:hypothetical protein